VYVSFAAMDNYDNRVNKIIAKLQNEYSRRYSSSFTVDYVRNFRDGNAVDNVPLAEDLIRNACIFIVVSSNNYFNNPMCMYELTRIYDRSMTSIGKDIVFSINMIPEEFDVTKSYFYEEKKNIIDYMKNIATEINWADIENLGYSHAHIPNANAKLDFLDILRTSINEYGLNTSISYSNYEIIDNEIDKRFSDRNKIEHELKRGIGSKINRSASDTKVAVIYTGGTIGMIEQIKFEKPPSLRIAKNCEEILPYFPQMRQLPFEIDLYSYSEPLDSSNIDATTWLRLSDIICGLYDFYKGFVILHGTNTIVYTASALSFMLPKNFNKPVILTGSELPLVELNSDASKNFLDALKAVGVYGLGYINEVCIMFDGMLFRGNRTVKKHASRIKDVFYSPNCDLLGEVIGEELFLNYGNVLKTSSIKTGKLDFSKIEEDFDSSFVYIIDIYPHMDFGIFDYIYEKATRESTSKFGIVLKTYGTGNAPTFETFVKQLERLIKSKVIIINTTQCREGTVETRLYETASNLFDIGVINGFDITAEAAYCKLKVLFATEEIKDITSKMQQSLAGEMSNSYYTVEYPKNITGDLYEVSLNSNLYFKGEQIAVNIEDSYRIKSAIMRIKDIVIKSVDFNEDTLLTVDIYINGKKDDSKGHRVYQEYQVGSFAKTATQLKHSETLNAPHHTKEFLYTIDFLNVEIDRDKLRNILKSYYNSKGTTAISVRLYSEKYAFTFESLQLNVLLK